MAPTKLALRLLWHAVIGSMLNEAPVAWRLSAPGTGARAFSRRPPGGGWR